MSYENPFATPVVDGLPNGVVVASPGARVLCWFLDGVLMSVTLGIGWLIWAGMLVSKGQTPAKKLLNLRVVDIGERRVAGFGTMFFMRGLVAGFVAGIAIPLTLGILLFMPFWDKRKQNLWDKISNTSVVSDPDDAWGLDT